MHYMHTFKSIDIEAWISCMEAFYNSYSFLNLRLSNTNQRRKEGGREGPSCPPLLILHSTKGKERERERERVSERESEKHRQTDICKQMI